jgi:hypothetical protein
LVHVVQIKVNKQCKEHPSSTTLALCWPADQISSSIRAFAATATPWNLLCSLITDTYWQVFCSWVCQSIVFCLMGYRRIILLYMKRNEVITYAGHEEREWSRETTYSDGKNSSV